MEKIGTILEIKPNSVVIQLDEVNQNNCKGCRLQKFCRPLLSKKTAGRCETVELFIHSHLPQGTRVKIVLNEGRSILASFLLFIMPLILIIGSLLLFSYLGNSEFISLLMAITIGILYFILIFSLEKHILSNIQVIPLKNSSSLEK